MCRGVGSWVGCGQCQGLSFVACVLPEYFRVQCSKLHAGFTSGLVDHLPMCPTYLFHGCHVFAGNIICL